MLAHTVGMVHLFRQRWISDVTTLAPCRSIHSFVWTTMPENARALPKAADLGARLRRDALQHLKQLTAPTSADWASPGCRNRAVAVTEPTPRVPTD